MIDYKKFENALETVKNNYTDNGIGTYSEKLTHRVLKYYINDNPDTHEIRYRGYIADVMDADEIFEIQTKQLYTMQNKLRTFMLDKTVTIVLPVIRNKQVVWVSPQNNSIIDVRKSNKHETIYKLAATMYELKEFIGYSALQFRIILMDEVEYKYLDGGGHNNKNNATKINRIPSAIIEDLHFKTKQDFYKLVPFTYNDEFTADDYKNKTRLNITDSRRALLILLNLGVVQRIGKEGRKYKYKIA